MRRSAIAPISAIATAIASAASATGSAWKLPPEMMLAVAANTSGLSVTALASRSSTSAAWRSWSRQAPTTCGWQRSEYGSCTRSSPSRCEWRIALPCEQRAVVPRHVDLPGWPRSAWMRGSNGPSLPRAASTVSAPTTSAASSTGSKLSSACKRERGRDLRAVDQRQAFLGRELQRRDAGVAQALRAAGLRAPSTRNLALADQRQRHVRQRREVARRADRALARHERQQAGVVHREQRVDHRFAHARAAAREATPPSAPASAAPPAAAAARRRRRCASGSG